MIQGPDQNGNGPNGNGNGPNPPQVDFSSTDKPITPSARTLIANSPCANEDGAPLVPFFIFFVVAIVYYKYLKSSSVYKSIKFSC